MSVCVKYIVSAYDNADSFEVLSTYDEELLTTSMNKNSDDDYLTAESTSKDCEYTTPTQDTSTLKLHETTIVEELSTTTEKITTTVKDTSSVDDTTVQKFIYRTNDIKANEIQRKTTKKLAKYMKYLKVS